MIAASALLMTFVWLNSQDAAGNRRAGEFPQPTPSNHLMIEPRILRKRYFRTCRVAYSPRFNFAPWSSQETMMFRTILTWFLLTSLVVVGATVNAAETPPPLGAAAQVSTNPAEE